MRMRLEYFEQPSEPATDVNVDHDEEWVSASATNFLSVIHHNFGKNISAPFSRKNSFCSLASAAAAAVGSTNSKTDYDDSTRTNLQGDASPVKRAKLHFDSTDSDTSGGRSLRSCPDFVRTPAASSGCTEKRATFCCQVVKKQTSYQASSNCKQPQFVVPKCWKVGSWPSRYDRSTKPAGDVPFWSCSEWFCTVHKRLEFGFLNAKINGDTKSLAAPSSGSCGGSDRTTTSSRNFDVGTLSGQNNYVDVDIFEIDPPLPPPPSQQQQQIQQIWNFGRSSSQQRNESEQQQVHVVPEMFDAPRFILHIINEDDSAIKEKFTSTQKQSASRPIIGHNDKNANLLSDWTSFFELGTSEDLSFTPSQLQKINTNQFANDNNSPWAVQSEFGFGSTDGNGNVDVTNSINNIFPVDVSRLAQQAEVNFCLPKCGRFPTINQQQQRQQQPLLAPSTTTAGFFNKLLENQTTTSENQAANENTNPKQQPQSVAVPIKDNTHFIPIRSESMEDAYYLKPGFDECCAVIEIGGWMEFTNR